MTDMTVSRTILEQLGGRRFSLMTGAKNFIGSENALSFKIPKSPKNKANFVRIRLNAMDTYDIEFLYLHALNSSVKGYKEGVYADQLQAVFTAETGLETSLGSMGKTSEVISVKALKRFDNRHEN